MNRLYACIHSPQQIELELLDSRSVLAAQKHAGNPVSTIHEQFM
jgi:hypothetical protein